MYGVTGDNLFYNSIEEACYIAVWILGEDLYSYDYDVYIMPELPNATSLMGPSLSLAVTLATLAELLGLKPRSDAMVTGMINPDGSVGFVGFVKEKAEAAERYGFSLFVYIFTTSGQDL